MNRFQIFCLSAGLAGAAALAGCSSSSSGCDGDAACTTTADSSADTGVTLYGLPGGTNCFVVTSVVGTPSDGCGLDVANAAMTDPANFLPITIPLNYDPTTKVVTLGTDGALGGGIPTNNKGTLVRENDTSSDNMATCTWHQKDTSLFELTADAKFTVSVTEVETNFAAACTAGTVPTGGSCTSTWTWTMAQSTKLPPSCK